MRVLIQRSSDGSFLKGENVWVQCKQEALAFPNCTPAIDHCVERKLSGVRLWLSFEDPKHDFPMEVFRAETRMLVNYNQRLRDRQRELMDELDSAQAAQKERKRQFQFPRAAISDDRGLQPPVTPGAAGSS